MLTEEGPMQCLKVDLDKLNLHSTWFSLSTFHVREFSSTNNVWSAFYVYDCAKSAVAGDISSHFHVLESEDTQSDILKY